MSDRTDALYSQLSQSHPVELPGQFAILQAEISVFHLELMEQLIAMLDNTNYTLHRIADNMPFN